MLRTLVGAGLAALAILPAEAGCLTRGEIEAFIAANAPDAVMRLLTGSQSRAFLAAYNAEPPVSALTGDEVLIVALPAEHAVRRVAIFERGCMVRGGRMPEAAVRRFLKAIERSHS